MDFLTRLAGAAAVLASASYTDAATLFGTEVVLDNTQQLEMPSGTFVTLGPTFGTPGPHFLKTMTGLALDPNSGTLFGVSPSTDQLFVIDRVTGEGTSIGPVGGLGQPNVNGLAYDSNSGVLYGTDTDTNTLLTINRTTGIGIAVGVIGGADNVEGLAFDAGTNTLYGIASFVGQTQLSLLVTLDTSTALATPLPTPLPLSGTWRGLAFDRAGRKLYASLVHGTGIFEIDPDSGTATYLGNTGGTNSSLQGLAALPEPTTATHLAVLACMSLLLRVRRTPARSC